ncbi:MAG TPA: DUF5117 domain-containing protein [Bryobacteraceae bacterium]|jgi:hypothetical protein|nr:DUF5117 domain-containing protein [Bryobacteraceae bacterium]
MPADLPGGGDTAALGRLSSGSSSQQPQAYDKVITKDAKSKTGLFTVHEIKDKYYYEIPKTELNREFLFVTQIARTTTGVGYGGQFVSERVVRWERNANKINLREVNYEVVADPKTPISLAVKAANNDTIVMSFPIAAFGKEPERDKDKDKDKDKVKDKDKDKVKDKDKDKDKDKESVEAKDEQPGETPALVEKPSKETGAKDAAKPGAPKPAAAKDAAGKLVRPEIKEYKETGHEPSIIIEVTRLFTSDVFELSARQRLNASTMDASRSYIERISPYPENIEVESTHTYTRMATPIGAVRTENPFAAGGMRPGSATVVLHHSMVKLPEHPMTPRLFDERVGYFSVRQMDYGRDEQRAPKRIYITR